MKKIKLSLNVKSINAAIKELDAYKARLGKAAEEITHTLTRTGVELAKQNAMYMDIYDNHALYDGIVEEYVGGFGVDYAKGYVHSTAPHSMFCEFGTGIVGAENPHPNITIPGWQYDTNEHGEKGWWYEGDDGEWHWTKGMPSRPYMYETAQKLRQIATDAAITAAKRVLK